MPTDLATAVGSVRLPNPVMTASGTAGHGVELADYGPLGGLGAVVVKSLGPVPWPGNPPPGWTRRAPACSTAWGCRDRAPRPGGRRSCPGWPPPGPGWWPASGAGRWRSSPRPPARSPGRRGVVAVEVNVSCPNLEDRSRMFAHSATATAEAVEAAGAAGLARWAKLSPNMAELVEIAGAALGAGAEALTLVNTLLGMSVDTAERSALGRRALGAGPAPGGVCGPSSTAGPPFPTRASSGWAGWPTARRPSSCSWPAPTPCRWARPPSTTPGRRGRCSSAVERWCRRHRVERVRQLVGAAHG